MFILFCPPVFQESAELTQAFLPGVPRDVLSREHLSFFNILLLFPDQPKSNACGHHKVLRRDPLAVFSTWLRTHKHRDTAQEHPGMSTDSHSSPTSTYPHDLQAWHATPFPFGEAGSRFSPDATGYSVKTSEFT